MGFDDDNGENYFYIDKMKIYAERGDKNDV